MTPANLTFAESIADGLGYHAAAMASRALSAVLSRAMEKCRERTDVQIDETTLMLFASLARAEMLDVLNVAEGRAGLDGEEDVPLDEEDEEYDD